LIEIAAAKPAPKAGGEIGNQALDELVTIGSTLLPALFPLDNAASDLPVVTVMTVFTARAAVRRAASSKSTMSARIV
jgi:hypothetical protein